MTGRPRAYYRKHKLSRIALRDLGSKGMIPGLRQVELVRRDRTMALNDPLGDHDRTHPQCADAQQVEGLDARPRGCASSVLDVLKTEGYIRGYASVEHTQRAQRARDRAQVFRRRAGDPRDLARVEAGPARLCLGEEPAARQQRSRRRDPVHARRASMADHDARDANVGGEILCTVF